MYQPARQISDSGRVERYVFRDGDVALTYKQAIELWRDSDAFREAFVGVLRSCDHDAYFWETPAVTREAIVRPFEFVLVGSTPLSRVAPDRLAFKEHFRSDRVRDDVVAFANLGGTSTLIAPYPVDGADGYAHIASFARSAPMAQQHALWRWVAHSVEHELDDRPLWISTSGLGIYWLHVRLDRRPKYYTHQPYKAPPL